MPTITTRPEPSSPKRFSWDALGRGDVGPLAVALVRDELASHGFQVRQPDHRTSTLLARRGSRELEVHIRSARSRAGAPYWTKHGFALDEDRFAAVVILDNRKPPALYLIPSLAWHAPDDVLRDLPNPGGQTPPEWRFNISRKNNEALMAHSFSKVAAAL
jgi:hypothetical protein